MRICITGGPRTGKTTLSRDIAGSYGDRLGATVAHTDSLIHLGWSEASLEVSHWLDAPGPWVIEGVAVSRAIRKWIVANQNVKPPIDKLIILSQAFSDLLPGQASMARGVVTVTGEIEPWLRECGISIERRTPIDNGGWVIVES